MGKLKWVLALDSIVNVWWVITIVAVGAIAFGAGIFVKDVYIDDWECVAGKTEVRTFFTYDGIMGYPFDTSIIGESEICAKAWKKTSIHGPRLQDDAELYDWHPKNWLPWIKPEEADSSL